MNEMNLKLIKLTPGDVDLVALQFAQGRCPSHLQAEKSFLYHTEIGDWRHRSFGDTKIGQKWKRPLENILSAGTGRHKEEKHQLSLS